MPVCILGGCMIVDVVVSVIIVCFCHLNSFSEYDANGNQYFYNPCGQSITADGCSGDAAVSQFQSQSAQTCLCTADCHYFDDIYIY